MPGKKTQEDIAQLRAALRENRRQLGKLLIKAEELEGVCDQARTALRESRIAAQRSRNN